MVVQEENEEYIEDIHPSHNPFSQSMHDRDKRLIISHIENINFKSYAGKCTLGPFHKSFSSIVGPNGSGKSNVIDAMLFVFGYRSKKIRSKKVSMLIHNSENHQNIDSCTVTVYFQKIVDLPGDDFEVVPNSQFNVSRIARKDGSSDYYMNGKKQTFKEIGIVLRACGIDLDHNRFLILQGEVEQISMMKPKAESEHDEGMLEYLEDIIGTNCYKKPIEQVSKDVEDLNEKRGEKLNRVKAVEKEKDLLEGSKNEATEYLLMENKITKKQHVLYQKYIHDCEVIEGKSVEKREDVKTHLQELQQQLKGFVDQKKEKGREYQRINKLFDELVEEAEKKKKAFAEFEKYDLKLREDLKHRKANRKKFNKSLDTEKTKLEEFQNVPKKSQAEVEKLTKSLEQLEEHKDIEEKKLSEIMAGLKHETKGIQLEKEAKEHELMEKQKAVNETKSKLDIATSEIEIYLSQHKKLWEQCEQAKDNVEKAKNIREEKKSQLSSIEDDLSIAKKELLESQSELKTVTKQEAELSTEVKESRSKVEESRNAMQASQSKGAVIEALMKEKKRGSLTGIYGRLGDLGGIDKKYDIAISTACGPLDFIVCDTMDTAQKGVEFLKKNNVGSTTFIALDKVNNWKQRANSSIKTPGNVKRLYDLVHMKDDAVKTAFYYALKDTLVADTLDQATQIAYPKDPKAGRWRVVTLKGELIEMSGTMSGGGNKPSKGRMGCRVIKDVDPKVVEKLQRDLNSNLQEVETLRKRKSTLEDTVSTLLKQIKTMEHQVEKLKMEIQALTVQEKEQKERVKDLTDQVNKATPDPNHQNKLQRDIDTFEKLHKKSSEAARRTEKEVQSLHNQIMGIGKARLAGQQEKVDSINNLIDEVTQKKTKESVAIKTASRNIKKAEEKVKSIEQDIDENDSAIEHIEQVELKKLEDDATRVLNEAQEGQEKMKEMQVKLEEVKTAFEATDKDEADLRSKEIDLKHEFQKYENTVKENHSKILHWKNKLNGLNIHKIHISVTTESQPVTDELLQLTLDELKEVDDTAIAYEVTVLTEKLAEMKPNMATIAEYFKKEEAYLFRVKELEDVTDERDNKRKELDGLRKQRLDEFMTGFGVITTKLKEMYQMITLGGDAELELVDSLDPFSEGIVFSVRPPKKSWKNISNLSGGEKTLSSLALVFALHHFKPTPLYVMDEIDAALDFKNVSIVANYIKERTKNAQFIIISLRNNMFEMADRLVGIYKTDNCTKTVVLNPKAIT